VSGPTATLAEFISSCQSRDIPDEVLEVAQALVLDNAGVALTGVLQPVYRHVAKAVDSAYGTSDHSMVIGRGAGAILPAAVFLNGVAIGDFEFEHVGSNAHPAASVFPTALALTSQLDRSGTDLLTAMLLGYEVSARIGRASSPRVESERGFHNPGLNGTLGAAAAASWLLGLSPGQTASALGIAASSSAGLMAFATTGAMTKRLHPGRAGQLGLEAALLAQNGVTGPSDVLENPAGFLHAFSPDPDVGALTLGLGSKWVGSEMLIKLAPVHGHAQLFAYAIGQYFAHTERPPTSDIRSVRVTAGRAANDRRHRESKPTSLVDAQYSVVFCIAACLARPLSDDPLLFNDQLLADLGILHLAQSIAMEEDARIPFGGTITLNIAGTEVTLDATEYPFSNNSRALWDLVSAKFHKATQRVVAEDQKLEISSSVRELRSVSHLNRLTGCLATQVA
jgi:2-methylcitrate dehydratase PrpD